MQQTQENGGFVEKQIKEGLIPKEKNHDYYIGTFEMPNFVVHNCWIQT